MGRLTALQIRNLKEPGRYSDGDGLSVLLSASRKGYWVLRATIKGRRRDIGLGTVDLVTLKEARGMALELRRDIQRGIDPIAEREKQEIKILTFAEAARKVHQEQKAGWKNGKHQEQWITTLEKYAFPMLGKRLVNDIEGPLVRECLVAIWLKKPETARRVKQRIGMVLDWAYRGQQGRSGLPAHELPRQAPRTDARLGRILHAKLIRGRPIIRRQTDHAGAEGLEPIHLLRLLNQSSISCSIQPTERWPKRTGVGNVPSAMKRYIVDLLKPTRCRTSLRRILKQGELNIDVLDRTAAADLAHWFEERWTDRFCLDITAELIEVIERSWARETPLAPYQIYLKMAYHLSREAREGLAEFRLPREFRGILFGFQEEAVRIAARHLSRRGGVILGDVVGLGKTLMATALVKTFEELEDATTLILCPKNLTEMWEGYRERYGLKAKILSTSLAINELPDLQANRWLATRYGKGPQKPAVYAAWLKSHKPFNWFTEFYDVMHGGGFDAVVGNPPYVQRAKIKDYGTVGYETAETPDIYAQFVERSFGLLGTSAHLGLIIPISFQFSDDFARARAVTRDNADQIWLSTFSRNPAALFFAGLGVRNTILIAKDGGGREPSLYASRLHRWITGRSTPMMPAGTRPEPSTDWATRCWARNCLRRRASKLPTSSNSSG